jgi:recombinational DNA repair ATPase RecF
MTTTNGKPALRVARVRIRNVMGISELEFSPRAVTVITGGNGTGKSSIIAALTAPQQGGHDPSLLRIGEEEGEVIYELNDGTEIRERITATKSTLTVKDPERGAISKPKTFLDRLTNTIALNPVEFLTCSDEQRIRYVLESSPATLTAAQLRAAVGGALEVPDEIPGHPLRVVEKVHKAVYELRTGKNAIARDSGATADQLAKGIPQLDADELAAEVEAAELEEQEIRQRFAKDRDFIQREVARLEASYARELEQLRQRLAALEQEAESAIEAASEAVRPKVEALQQDLEAALRPVTDRAAAARAQLALLPQIENQRVILRQHRAKAEKAHAESKQLTEALARLDALKLELMEQSPVKGLEIRDGELYFRNVPWSRVNTGEQVKVALKLAKHRAGELPLVCVDGLESLDPQTFDAFLRSAPKTGLQFVVTRVSEGPLRIDHATWNGGAQ